MANYSDTLAPGRIDLIIFANGGKEVIGRQDSYPVTPESAYISEVNRFVATKQGLEKPEKFTGYYTVKGNEVTMTWTQYAGELPQKVEEGEVE